MSEKQKKQEKEKKEKKKQEQKKQKKEKKKQKEKKEKKRPREESNELFPVDSSLTEPAASIHVSLDIKTSSLGWGPAFAAAAQVQPEGLDNDFLNRTDTHCIDEGLSKIRTLLPNDEPVTKKGKMERKPDSDVETCHASQPLSRPQEVEDPVQPMEGRMVPHPNKHGQEIMILVDTDKKIAFSAIARTDEGNMIVLGTVNTDRSIFWREDAFPEETDDYAASIADFPFSTDPDDHCESPLEAYTDIVSLLEQLEDYNTSLSIYDPYFCNGSVKVHLKELGFPKVYNEKEDCYLCWKSGVGYPAFDVLVTNPPYSDEHIPKLLAHVTSKTFTKPFMLLLPDWVHKKEYYTAALKRSKIQPFYLVPKKRYVYLPPPQFREKKRSDVHKKSSPFVSMWYIWGGSADANYELMEGYRAKFGNDGLCDVARTKNALRDLRRKDKRKQVDS